MNKESIIFTTGVKCLVLTCVKNFNTRYYHSCLKKATGHQKDGDYWVYNLKRNFFVDNNILTVVKIDNKSNDTESLIDIDKQNDEISAVDCKIKVINDMYYK